MIKEHTGIVKAWEARIRKSRATKRRANRIFTPMSVAHADDADEHGPGEVYHAEKIFPGGDFYTGQWCDKLPHGQGKFLWTDGCMYVGEWYKGKTMGKGRFSWPSGATYEGDFKIGFMDGKGTYTGSSGDTFRGSWVMNFKHGNGTHSYSNGDYYEGEWRRGSQDGHGRYQWKNGTHYTGQWRNGLAEGNGTMIWSNGNRYDGFWEESFPKGNGTFRWPDGSFYVGVWNKDPQDQTGTYYPSGSPSGSSDWDPQQLFTVDLNDYKICPGEKISIFPSQKMPNWFSSEYCLHRSRGTECRPRRTSVDGRVSNYSSEFDTDANGDGDFRNGNDGLQLDDSDARHPRMKPLRVQPVKKQGETISKGHKNYELMLNLQLGIRYMYFYVASCMFELPNTTVKNDFGCCVFVKEEENHGIKDKVNQSIKEE